jgi:co-chaperonin GroES (HSP10)
MKAVGNWVLIKQAETTTASGLTVSNLNIGEIISVPRRTGRDTLDFNNGDKVYFNKRNAITIEEYLLVTIHDIFLVIT